LFDRSSSNIDGAAGGCQCTLFDLTPLDPCSDRCCRTFTFTVGCGTACASRSQLVACIVEIATVGRLACDEPFQPTDTSSRQFFERLFCNFALLRTSRGSFELLDLGRSDSQLGLALRTLPPRQLELLLAAAQRSQCFIGV
jgi:hypothetical protein